MINEIGIYDSNGDLQSVEQLGALGTNVSVNVNGLNSNNANAAIGELNSKIDELDESVGQDINEVNQSVTELEKKLGKSGVVKPQDELLQLEVGKLESGSIRPTQVSTSQPKWGNIEDATTLRSRSFFMFPQLGLTYTVHINSGYKALIADGSNLDAAVGDYVADGGTVTIPSTAKYYRILVKKTDGSAFSEGEEDAVGLVITYKNTPATWPISARAYQQTKNQMGYIDEASDNGRLPLIGHISDTHSDNVRTQRFLDFCEDIGVTCACITGDYASEDVTKNPFYWIPDMVNKCKCNVMVTTGNHDGSNDMHWTMTYKEMSDKLHLYGNMSYYKDFPSAKLRIISVDQTDNWTYSKAIEDWVCEAVLGTPAGYGLLIQYHIPETRIYGALASGESNNFYDVLTQGAIDWYSNLHQITQRIVDAFIAGGTYRKTYTKVVENGEEVGAPFSFAQKNSGAVFVAHVNGHMHADAIFDIRNAQWYIDNPYPLTTKPTHKQIMLNVTSGCIDKGFGVSKSYTAYTQDAFNVYAIDLENEVINVVRIGWDKNGTRKTMTIKFTEDEN